MPSPLGNGGRRKRVDEVPLAKNSLPVFGTEVHLLPASIPSLSHENGSFRQYGFFGGQRGLSFPKESPLISYPYIFTSVIKVTITGLRLVFW